MNINDLTDYEIHFLIRLKIQSLERVFNKTETVNIEHVKRKFHDLAKIVNAVYSDGRAVPMLKITVEPK